MYNGVEYVYIEGIPNYEEKDATIGFCNIFDNCYW